jgi:hypothetical protein
MAFGSNVQMWATAVSTNPHDGRKIIFRYAKELNAGFDQACQPVRISIVWKYHSEYGQPASEDHERMNQLEDALESVLKDDRFATLALVSTGENLRRITQHSRMNSWRGSTMRWLVIQHSRLKFTHHVIQLGICTSDSKLGLQVPESMAVEKSP